MRLYQKDIFLSGYNRTKKEKKRMDENMMKYIAHEQIGYFCKDSEQWVDKKLAYQPYAQAGVIFDANGIHLISYTTLVCTIDNDGYLSCTGTYSQTTRKHIGSFLKEYAPNLCYYDAKRCYEKGEMIHIDNGDIKMIA
jgi:hypothetical protein